MTATCDRPCPVNLAQHSYFNLRGHDSGVDVMGHSARSARVDTPLLAPSSRRGRSRRWMGRRSTFEGAARRHHRAAADRGGSGDTTIISRWTGTTRAVEEDVRVRAGEGPGSGRCSRCRRRPHSCTRGTSGGKEGQGWRDAGTRELLPRDAEVPGQHPSVRVRVVRVGAGCHVQARDVAPILRRVSKYGAERTREFERGEAVE